MKDSEIQWIGYIPSTWKLNKIAAIYEERNERVSDTDFPPLSVTKQGVVPQLETAAKTSDGDNRKLIRKNDFVINSRSDRRGSCGISEYDGSCSLINTVLKPRRNICNAYYSFVFRSECFADEFYRWGNGIVDDLWSTKWSNMKRIYVPSPSLQEQQRIADYLDRKCSQIDAIIARQQEVIEKLKAYKLSIITEAVTKGLNPDVPMKDSGVEWIGEIPEHWKIRKAASICSRLVVGVVIRPAEYFDIKGTVPFLRGVNVKDFSINTDNLVYITDETNKMLSKSVVHSGDILIVRDGNIGAACVVPPSLDGSNVVSMVIMTPMERYNSHYICYFINSNIGKLQFELTKIGSALTHTSVSAVSKLQLAIPPEEEQKEIVSYLKSKCDSIDVAVKNKGNLINKLANYKKSLIYEVVTGKKEV